MHTKLDCQLVRICFWVVCVTLHISNFTFDSKAFFSGTFIIFMSKDVIPAFLPLDTSMFPTIHLNFILLSSFPNSIFLSFSLLLLLPFFHPNMYSSILLSYYIHHSINQSFHPSIFPPTICTFLPLYSCPSLIPSTFTPNILLFSYPP